MASENKDQSLTNATQASAQRETKLETKDTATSQNASELEAEAAKVDAGLEASNPDGANQHYGSAAIAAEYSTAAKVATREAKKMSKAATDSASHEAAAAAHAKAKEMHATAAEKHTTAGDEEMAEQHALNAEKHDAMNKDHIAKMQACSTAIKAEDGDGDADDGLEAGAPMGNQNAAKTRADHMTKAADEASDKANKSGERKDHQEAAIAHIRASMHQDEAGNESKVQYHYQKYKEHTDKAPMQAPKDIFVSTKDAFGTQNPGTRQSTHGDIKSSSNGDDGLEASNPEGINQYTQAHSDAKQAAADAYRKSRNAKLPADHDDAADAHEKAAGKYAEAAKLSDDRYKAQMLNKTSELHIAKADFHKHHGNGMNSSDSKEQPDALAAKSSISVPAALECAHASVVLEDGVLMYMPGGTHTITPSQDGNPVTVTVMVDAAAAERIEEQRKRLEAAGKKPFFSIQHETEIAAAWPTRFFWDTRVDATGKTRTGVWAEVEWTKSGKEAIEGKDFRTFSPTFFVDAIRTDAGNPARIVCNDQARANMGALENDPAFSTISPLWARNAAGATGAVSKQTTENQDMTKETIAELQARNDKLEQKVAELKAKQDDVSRAELKAANFELAEIKARMEATKAQEENARLKQEAAGRIELDAERAVQRMVKSGKIPVRETDIQAQYKEKFVKDPTLIPLLAGDDSGDRGIAAANGNNGGVSRISPGGNSQQVHQLSGGLSVQGALAKYYELMSQNAAIDVVHCDPADLVDNYRRKGVLAMEAASLAKTDLLAKEIVARWEHLPARELAKAAGVELRARNGRGGGALQAADNTDANLGILSGTLVLQRTLPFFAYKYPELFMLYTDFNDTPGLYGQTEVTRIVVQPAVQKYDTTADATGRPKGWSTISTAKTTDVPITLTDYVSVPIVMSNATLASTNRRLFDEQAVLAIKALAGYFVGMLTNLVTAANYNGYAVINGNLVPVNYPTYVQGLQGWSMSDLDTLDAAFTNNQVPEEDRGIMLTPSYYAKLRGDPRLEFMYAASAKDIGNAGEFLTEARLPKLSGFAPIKAPYLPSSTPATNPTTNNVVGFAFQKAGAVLKARLPQDFTQALGVMIPGSVTTITDPDTKMSIMLVQYVNLTSNYAEWRPEVMLGAAVGDKRAGLVITSV